MILRDILHRPGGPVEVPYTLEDGSAHPRYILSDVYWAWLQKHKARHQAQGNGFGYQALDPDGLAPTLPAHYHKCRHSMLLLREQGNPRALTPRECARLMGFPDSFRLHRQDAAAWKQLGNAVVPQVVLAALDAVDGSGQLEIC